MATILICKVREIPFEDYHWEVAVCKKVKNHNLSCEKSFFHYETKRSAVYWAKYRCKKKGWKVSRIVEVQGSLEEGEA